MPETIESLLAEGRTFAPPEGFKREALVTGVEMYDEADQDVEGFWARQAADLLDWAEEWHTILDWDLPFAKWFVGGKLNAAYNCLDRHVAAGHGDQVAYHWEGEPGDTRTITYAELLEDVSRLSNTLRELGVRKGDRVNIYLGMVPELPISLLACARIGAPHSVVFGGFSSDSLRDRINDAEAKVLITADGAWRRGGIVPLKQTADQAIADCPTVEQVLVLRRTGQDGVAMTAGRDQWWHDVVPRQSPTCPPEPMDAEDLLYLLYTSGTTAKPKGIMHTTGGYLTQVAYTHRYVFDLKPDEDVYWCAADVGWVTGHSYIVYGPLINRATSVLYEGSPDFPDKDRLWQIAERYGVTILYTAPTAIRTFMKWGPDYPDRHDLSSLRLLGTVGEPINPEAWVWYWQHIGGTRCPVVDTWWQTETGAIMISPLPGATTLKPRQRDVPAPRHRRRRRRSGGDERPHPRWWVSRPHPAVAGDAARHLGRPGALPSHVLVALRRPILRRRRRQTRRGWLLLAARPRRRRHARLRTQHLDRRGRARPRRASRRRRGGRRRQERPHHRAGHRRVRHPASRQRGEQRARPGSARPRRPHHRPHRAPQSILFTEDLPKTRSGKIMRRLLRNVSEDEALGDTTTLADATVVEGIKARYLASQAAGADEE